MQDVEPVAHTAVFWDIDGTLLTTGRAGIFAWEAALDEICGAEIDLSDFHTSGMTDAQIAAALVDRYGTNGSPAAQADALLGAYERHLPGSLDRRKGRVLQGVVEILEDLSRREGVYSSLLTGNTPVGARAKLGHYGLIGYFRADGAFCLGPGDRDEIARRAYGMACEVWGRDVPTDRVFVVGDTPRDVECGKAIGARTIAVATGTYSLEELQAAEPWCAVAELPSPSRFAVLLGLD